MYSSTPSTSSDSIGCNSSNGKIFNDTSANCIILNSYKIFPHRTMKILPQNHWNPNDCHQKLHLIWPDCKKVLCLGKSCDFGGFSVRGKSMMSINCGFLYYEVKIHQGQNLSIGLATKMMPLGECVGSCFDTYAYDSGGIFRSVCTSTKTVRPKFGAGDIVGCGVQLATRQLIYTKNGERLNTANLFARPDDLYPCVTLKESGDLIEATFGPHFRYNLQLECVGPNKKSDKN